ncbi:MAG: hypothetical protein KatS3mg011_1821 [Acidimicrobiia bacterium]|nr:MAG: hypothetical protein KatS3mg011_1821 [Acidimicrobiia bacterium]
MGQDPRPGYHQPVMADRVAEILGPVEGTVVDATFGGGGHSRVLKAKLGDKVQIIGIDKDPAAAEQAARLGVRFVRGDFGRLAEICAAEGITSLAGVLFDFGVSSHQLDTPKRWGSAT